MTAAQFERKNMEITKDESGRLLTLGGPLDIREASQLLEALRDFTAAAENPVLDLAGVTVCDAAALQLLHSARLTVEKAGRRFEISRLSSAVQEAGEALGLALPARSEEVENVT